MNRLLKRYIAFRAKDEVLMASVAYARRVPHVTETGYINSCQKLRLKNI